MKKTLYRGAKRVTVEADRTILRCTYEEEGSKPRVYESIIGDTKTKKGIDRIPIAFDKKIKDLLKKGGYSEVEGELKDKEEYSCMLLSNYDKFKDTLEYPVIATVKKDGIRGIYKEGVMRTRGNELIDLPHLKRSLTTMLPTQYEGELWSPGKSIEEITSMIAEKDTRVGFYLFDFFHPLIPDMSFLTRLKWLYRAVTRFSTWHMIKPKLIKSEEELDYFYKRAIDNGEEGIVVRSLFSTYEFKRSTQVLKRKPLNRGEYEIVGVDYDTDVHLGKLIKFHLRLPKNDETFLVVPRMSKEDRAKAFEEYSMPGVYYIGKMYTIEHRGFTKYGVPKHAVGIGLREDL